MLKVSRQRFHPKKQKTIRREVLGITVPGSGTTSHGIKISNFLFFFCEDWGTGLPFLSVVRSGTEIYHAFGIKDQTLRHENRISDETAYLFTTLRIVRASRGESFKRFPTYLPKHLAISAVRCEPSSR